MAGNTREPIANVVIVLKALLKVLETKGIIHPVTANTLLDLITTKEKK